MPNVLSGIVLEVGDGFIVLASGLRIAVSSRVLPNGLARGARVVVTARLRGSSEWIAEDIVMKD
jgi:hypothetical protein